MPRCPECKEPIEKGQTHCFACGSDFILTPAKSQFFRGKTLLIVAVVGGSLIALAVALLIARPKTRAKPDSEGKPGSAKPLSQTVTPAKAKEPTPTNDIVFFNQQLADLETKISAVEKRSKTEQFSKDETDALRFSQNLLVEMRSSLQSMKNAKTPEEQKRFARQFRLRQNEIESFLIILKNRL